MVFATRGDGVHGMRIATKPAGVVSEVCEPLRECGSNLDCDTNFCLPAEGSSGLGYCRAQSVFCASDTHCSEGQLCDIFSGRCVVNVNCGQDDSQCGSQPGYACNPVGNAGQGACIYAATPCNTSLNCASYEECRYVSPGKDEGGQKDACLATLAS